jgi:ankyrin repeat protein
MSGVKLTAEAEKGNVAEVHELFAKGADPESGERYSESKALIHSCLSGNPRIVKLILDHGESVDPVDATAGAC